MTEVLFEMLNSGAGHLPVKEKQSKSSTGDQRREEDYDVALSVSNLNKSFGGQVVLDDVSVKLRRGQIVLLRGDNGAGKTTLLNILTGNLKPDKGTIETCATANRENFVFPAPWWANLNLFSRFTPERLSREGIGRMWQEIRLFNSLSLRDNIAVAQPNQLGENPVWALLRGPAWMKQERLSETKSRMLLEKLGLSAIEDRSADQISLGQSKRVAIARAVQAGAKILFLDEPLSGLDTYGLQEVLAMLRELSSSGAVTLVIVEHLFNIPHILNIASAVWTLRAGKLIEEDPAFVQTELRRSRSTDLNHLLGRFVGPNSTVINKALIKQAKLSSIASSDNQVSEPVLEVRDLVVHRGKRLIIGEIDQAGQLHGLSFTLYK